jgi:hypothetical protein
MKNALRAALIAIPLTFSLTGCIIVNSDEGARADWIDSNSSWENVQKQNKRKIANLNVGDDYKSVRSDMGTPDFNEAYSADGKEYQVIFYRTNRTRSDGHTTKDECTPLIFVDGKLMAWGQKAYDKL